MPDEYVTITLDPPRKVTAHGRKYVLVADGVPNIILPSKVFASVFSEGVVVDSVSIPKWLALDRGLVSEDIEPVQLVGDSVSRHDWFLGCAIIGMLASDRAVDMWEARKLAYKAME